MRKPIFGFRQFPTQTSLYSHRRWLKAGNFRFRKKRNRTIRVEETKALISAFLFAYADRWFSYAAAHLSSERRDELCNYFNGI